ncbi:hypothetical protein GQ43DRAFT_472609 [Delitschia confertaspora ATCC 74209]|uniref:Swiss Army Knife RNA repair protein HAD domain-containing protein n=1 Tax=Delitschia confertaspora ATCC 74209 TaxID=1513339 RepID=A0A9P4MY49_9PLEO|nr:hypothetical protein GQ43DRAFT_472609 [Delitschia confertaspora ATCC 74209]
MMQHYSTQSSSHGGQNGADKKALPRTITALKRWSCSDRDLPPVSDIKAIHVYDFDNTLFASPLPNKQLWNGPTVGQLAAPDVFLNGGWWHDSTILASTGEGVEKEEPRGWKGWWNEHIITLVELSMQQKDALNVLLTGRSEKGFAELIQRMVKSRNLDFHMICLKPAIGPAGQKFSNTMAFKQVLLKEIVCTYKEAEEIRIYEDRPPHTKAFRDFFFQWNKDLYSGFSKEERKPINAEVIQVAENATQLDPVDEVAEVQRMINIHNTAIKNGTAPPGTIPYQIKKTVFYTGYMIPPETTEKLISLVKLPPAMPDADVRYLANSILITPKPCPSSILHKVGGIGKKVTWKVTGVACYENKLWAARVEPVPKTQRYYSENPVPTVVLAIRRGGRPADAVRINNWHPVPEEQAYTFESTVGEKMLLRVEAEHANESEWESYFPNKNHRRGPAREDTRDESFIPLDANGAHLKDNNYRGQNSGPREQRDDKRPSGVSANYRGGNRDRGHGHHGKSAYAARGGRGSRGHGGHGSHRGGGRGRGRNGPGQYRSLDDVGEKNYGGQSSYDDPNSYY